MCKQRIRKFMMLALLTISISVYCNTYASEEETDRERPPTRSLDQDEISLEDDFKEFKRGPFFLPPHPGLSKFLGYNSAKDMFTDFRDKLEDSDVSSNICSGQTGTSEDGSIKLTFECDDDYSYSCYADNVSNSYAVNIPDEVIGLSCVVTVESVSLNDEEEDVDYDGTETTEEVVLDEDLTVEINIE